MKSFLFALATLVLIGCSNNDEVVIPAPTPTPVTTTVSAVGEDITVYTTDCNQTPISHNVKAVECKEGGFSFKAECGENAVVAGSVVFSYNYALPSGSPNNPYMPEAASTNTCPVCYRPCGLKSNCLKISVYGE